MIYRCQRLLGRRCRPAFIVSAPRSGSTWLRTALNAHPEVLCTENRLFGGYFDVLEDEGAPAPRLRVTLDRYVRALMQSHHDGAYPVAVDAVEAGLTGALAHAVFDTASRLTGKPVVVDKITPYEGTAGQVVQLLKQHFPDARVTLLLRDGRDVATSGVFHWLTKRQRGILEAEQVSRRRALFSGQPTSGRCLQRFFTDDEIRHWSRQWAQVLTALSPSAHLIIRYEDMIQDQLAVLGLFAGNIGVSSKPVLLDRCVQAGSFKSMSGGRTRGQEDPKAHVRKGIVGDWRNYFTRRDGQIFSEETGPWLVKAGYEKHDSWWQELPEALELRAS